MSLVRFGGNSDVYVYGQGVYCATHFPNPCDCDVGEWFTVHVGNKARGKKFEPWSWTVCGPAACEKLLRELVAKGARVPELVFKELYDGNHS